VRRLRQRIEVVLSGDTEETIQGTDLLVAIGRRPNIDALDLAAARVKYEPHGIVVNKRFSTSNRRIYAIGDVTGLPAFTHSANHQAALLIRHLLFRLPIKMNIDEIPRVTFTDPELAHVGLTDAAARERHRSIRVLRWRHDRRCRCSRADHRLDARHQPWAQHPCFCRNCDALSDLYGDRKTGCHHLFHATFDDQLGAAHFEPAALVWLRPRKLQ
jgi:pyruvate/2-oxoglutarate dehydrogenase complex dihydrolipoamide dehydrogenase (E3) component